MIRRLITGMSRRQRLRLRLVDTCYQHGHFVPNKEIEKDIDYILKGQS